LFSFSGHTQADTTLFSMDGLGHLVVGDTIAYIPPSKGSQLIQFASPSFVTSSGSKPLVCVIDTAGSLTCTANNEVIIERCFSGSNSAAYLAHFVSTPPCVVPVLKTIPVCIPPVG